jgi:hypothetical protein
MRKRSVITAFATMLALGVAAIVPAAPASAAYGDYVEIVNAVSGKCADVEREARYPGAAVHQWTCHNDANQLWRPEDQGNGYARFRNLNSDLCMVATRVRGSIYAIVQDTCVNGSNRELWRWEVADEFGHEVLQSALGNLCLALDGVFSAQNGWAIVLHDCATTSGQFWHPA